MKIIGDDGTEYALTENEDTALASIIGVYIMASSGETEGASQLLLINEMMHRKETRRIVEIIGKTLAHKIGKHEGKTAEEVEQEAMEKITKKSESPSDILKKMLKNG